MSDLVLDRRDLLMAPLLAGVASYFGTGAAQGAGVDPTMTIVVPPLGSQLAHGLPGSGRHKEY